ncbi:MAG: hypothetical protein ABIS14_05080 [Sphingomonas sp.]
METRLIIAYTLIILLIAGAIGGIAYRRRELNRQRRARRGF